MSQPTTQETHQSRCDSCLCSVPTVKTKNTSVELCELCYTTHIGNAFAYPDLPNNVTPQMLAEATHYLERKVKAFILEVIKATNGK